MLRSELDCSFILFGGCYWLVLVMFLNMEKEKEKGKKETHLIIFYAHPSS